jgi:hypothetical protein
MIQNVPTADDLETISLRLYFNAWSSVTAMVTEFNQIIGLPSQATGEWNQYAESIQNDLQGVYALMLQSQEIGIKGLIARISPYLLLKKYDAKPLTQGSYDYDFSDFPTIDAGELIRAHNMFAAVPLPQSFSEDFDTLRRGRNKIAHLGVFNEKLDPHALIELLFKHYSALYPGRSWLRDRLEFISSERWASYDGGSDWSPRGAVLVELWDLKDDLTPSQHKIVFGEPAPEYVCPSCAHTLERHTGGSDPYGQDVPTAQIADDGRLACSLCSETFTLRQQMCNDDDCDGVQVAVLPDEERCIVCGGDQG